jgi:hypothetical protein
MDPAQACEWLLARLFVDAALRASFGREPEEVGREFGLDETALASVRRLDYTGLELAARSYARKRRAEKPAAGKPSPHS